MSGKIFPSSAWSRCVAVWALIFAYLWALFTLNFIRFSKKEINSYIFSVPSVAFRLVFSMDFFSFFSPYPFEKLRIPEFLSWEEGGRRRLFSLPSFQTLKHVLLFPFPTCSSPKSYPLAEAIQQLNALIFKKYWGSDPLDYQIVSKDFWGKTGKKSDSTPKIAPPGGRWSNLTPKITLPGGRWYKNDPQIRVSDRSIMQEWPPN